jgi:CBS domain-containing protein
MQVRDAMAKTFSTVSRSDTVERAAEVMVEEDCGFVPVLDNDRVVGVITDRDIVVQCIGQRHDNPSREQVDHIMTTGVHTIGPDDSLEAAAEQMAEHHIRRLPVVEQGRLAGILSHGNLVQALRGREAAIDATLGITAGA